MNLELDGSLIGGNISQDGVITNEKVNVEVGTTITISDEKDIIFTSTDGKIKVTKNDEIIFIGSKYHLKSKSGETYIIYGVESSEKDLRQIRSVGNGIKNVIIKKDGMFDKHINIRNNTNSITIGNDKPYDSRISTMYTTMGLEQPGWLMISDYLLPDWSRIRPQNWFDNNILLDGKYYAEGLLFPKRNEIVYHAFLNSNFSLMTNNGEIDVFYQDMLPYNSGIKLVSNPCTNGMVNSKSTFITTTLTFGETYPSNNITLFGIYTSDNSSYLELGITPSGFITSTVIYNGSSNINWTSTNSTYKFNLNTTYEVQFGYINGAYLLRINGSDNAKFSRNYTINGDIYFAIGSTDCIDGDVYFSMNNLAFHDAGNIVWQPQIENFKRNYETFGSPMLQDGLMSGFSSSSYIMTDSSAMDFTKRPWILETKFTTSSDISTQQIMFEGESGYGDALRIQIYQGYVYPGYNVNSSWIFMENASPALQPNTTYWYRVEILDGVINFYTSLDGIDYDLSLTKQISSYPSPKKYKIGCGESVAFLGTIDLNETKIIQSGEILWKPFTESYSEYRDTYKLYTTEEELSIEKSMSVSGTLNIDNGVVSGFTQTNYLTLPSNIANIPMDLYISFITSSDISSMQNILHKTGFLEVYVRAGNLTMWSSQTGEVVITTVQQNTKYWLSIHIEQSRQVYRIRSEHDYSNEIEKVVNHSNIEIGTTLMKFGGHIANTGNYWRGFIDFNETYMMVDNQLYWSPMVTVETSYDVKGLCTEDFVYAGQPMTLNAYRIIYNDDTEETLLGENTPSGENIKDVIIVKSGITVGSKNDFTWTYDSKTERFVTNNGVKLTLNVYPSVSIVNVSADEQIQQFGNNVYLMNEGTEVTVSVENEYYYPFEQTFVVNEDMEYDITLHPLPTTMDVNNFTYSINNDKIILTEYTGNDSDIVITATEE